MKNGAGNECWWNLPDDIQRKEEEQKYGSTQFKNFALLDKIINFIGGKSIIERDIALQQQKQQKKNGEIITVLYFTSLSVVVVCLCSLQANDDAVIRWK